MCVIYSLIHISLEEIDLWIWNLQIQIQQYSNQNLPIWKSRNANPHHGWLFVRARISADTIGRYIGGDKSISAYRLSVKFHRYANPGANPMGSGWPPLAAGELLNCCTSIMEKWCKSHGMSWYLIPGKRWEPWLGPITLILCFVLWLSVWIPGK